MDGTYWNLLWSSFRRILGPFITITSIPLAYIVWVYLPQQPIRLAGILPIILFLLMIIMTLLDATSMAIEKSKIRMPRILLTRLEQGSENINCLLEPSEFFSEGIAVSFYYAPPGSYEVNIGVGYVKLIQTGDKKIQAIMTQKVSGYDQEIFGLINNNINIIKNIYIKPSVQRSFLDGVES